MKKFNESLLKKSLLAIVIIALSVPATFFLSYNLIKAHAKNAALRDIAVIAESYKGEVCQFLEMTKWCARGFASDGFIRTRLPVAGASKPIPQLEWVLLTEINEDEMLSFMRFMPMSAPMSAGIIIIAGIVLFITFF